MDITKQMKGRIVIMKQFQNKLAGALVSLALVFGIGLCIIPAVSAQGRYNNQNGSNRSGDNYPNWGGSFELRQTALNSGYNEGTKEGQKARYNNGLPNYDRFNAYQKATKDYNSRLGDRGLYQRYFRAGFQNGYNGAAGLPLVYSEGNGNGNGNWNNNNGNHNGSNNGNWNNNGNNNGNNNAIWNNNGGWNNGRWTGSNNNGKWNNRDGWVNRGRSGDAYPNWGGNFNLRQTALNDGYNEGIKQGRKDRNKYADYDLNRFNSYQNADHDYSSRLGDRELYRRYYREAFQNGYEAGVNGN
ncbi:hypothetical protein BH10ACI3_BH10ACI3_18210 [soil metagenome]